MRPSILVVTTVHHPQDARIWHRQIGVLLAAGWRVTYAAPFTARGLSIDLEPPTSGGVLTCVDLPRAAGRRRLAAFRAARREIRTYGKDHDLVLLHDPELLLAMGKARNVVWDVHEDTPAAIVAKPWIPKRLHAIVGWIVKRVERWGEDRARLLLAEYGYRKRFRRAHPVVLNAVTVPTSVTQPFEPRAVYLGTVTMERGALQLAAVGRYLCERTGGELRLEVIGPAHGKAAQIMAAAEQEGHLCWRGFVPSGEALGALAGAIAGLSLLHDLPNYRHSMPTKLIEYMAHGVPAITTPLPVAQELIDVADGIVVPFGDADAAAEAIISLWQDRDRAAGISERAHEAVQARYDWSEIGASFEQILRRWAAK